MSLRRECTLTVHVPEALGQLDRPALVKACLGIVEKRQIKCIQQVGSYYRVTFASVEAKDAFATKGLAIDGINIPLQAPDNTTLVRVIRLPFEVSEQSLAVALSPFGVVLSQSFEKDKSDGLFTGTRLVRMRVNSPVPNKLHVAGYPCFAWYPGQPKLCHVCRSAGHLVADCPNRGLCRSCRKPGHVASKCPDRQANEADRPFAWGAASGPPAGPTAVEVQPEVEGASTVVLDEGQVDRDAMITEEGAEDEVHEVEHEIPEKDAQASTSNASPVSLDVSPESSSVTPSSGPGPSGEGSAAPSTSNSSPAEGDSTVVDDSSSPPVIDGDGFITVTHQRKKSSGRARQLISAVASLHSLERASRTLSRSRIPTRKSSNSHSQ